MTSIKDYITEAILKINAKSEIEKDGVKYHLVVSKNYDATGKAAKGYLAQYISDDNETLVGFTGEHINNLEEKIHKYCRENNIK